MSANRAETRPAAVVQKRPMSDESERPSTRTQPGRDCGCPRWARGLLSRSIQFLALALCVAIGAINAGWQGALTGLAYWSLAFSVLVIAIRLVDREPAEFELSRAEPMQDDALARVARARPTLTPYVGCDDCREKFIDCPHPKRSIAFAGAFAQERCVCGNRGLAGTHRTDGPCLAPESSQERRDLDAGAALLRADAERLRAREVTYSFCEGCGAHSSEPHLGWCRTAQPPPTPPEPTRPPMEPRS